MKNNRVLTKLIGLLYVAALFLLGVSPPVVAEQAHDGTVVSRPAGEVMKENFSDALTETEVSFAAGTFPTGSTELSLVLQPGETAKLEEFDKLRSLDATGSTNYEELMDYGRRHPEVELRYTVTLPDGQTLPNTAEEADLSGISSETVEETARLLGYLPALRRVELGSPESGTRITEEDMALLRTALPEAEIHYVVTLLGQELDPETESLDLSELKSEDVENAAAAISGLTGLKEISLRGGEVINNIRNFR